MKILIVLCLVAGAFASCPPNSKYNGCGTACPVTCDNYQDPPIACILMCNPGCHCDEGYVKNSEGNCVKPEECPADFVFPDDDEVEEGTSCLGGEDSGMCRGAFPMFFYDIQSGTCKEFIYGGCGGNGNVYPSEEACLKKCGGLRPRQSSSNALCELPAETGVCRGYFPRYHFDSASGQCKKFIYGGCGGNENNFKNLDECHNTCGNNQPTCGANERFTDCGTSCPLTCDNFQNPPKICNLMCNIGCECVEGYVRSADGRCVKPESCPAKALDRPDCDKAPETGLCQAYFKRFYYDQEAGMCKQFVYGGCGGNRNNFATEFECYNKCGALFSGLKAACHQEKEIGPCRALFPRYFFNKQSGKCELFGYGGCQGNDNNFATQDECEETCLA